VGSLTITATPVGETRQQAQLETRDAHTVDQTSMVDAIARRYVVPLALGLDVATTAIRVTETSVQLILPDLFAAWNSHAGLPLSIAYYTLNLVVIAGLALGVTASLFLAMPLLALVNRKLDNAAHIRRPRVRKEKVAALLRKRSRCVRYIWLACAVPLLFGVSYVLGGLHLSWLVWVTAFADIAAPIIVLFVITQTEREAYATDTQEQAIDVANGVVIGALRGIHHNASGVLQVGQAAMLRAGTDGDVEGMINAATPRDSTTRYLTVNDVCARLSIPTERDAPGRRRVARRVKDVYDMGGTAIIKGKPGEGYLIPGTLYDELFGDWQGGRPSATRTPRPSGAIVDRARPSGPRGAAALPTPRRAPVTTPLPISSQHTDTIMSVTALPTAPDDGPHATPDDERAA
jgi:hypothetical protein